MEIRGASKWYGPVIGLSDVSLELRPGITGLLGPNGSGKSTLMRLIAGASRPSLGEVLVLGEPIARRAPARRRVGYSPEGDGFFEEMSLLGFVEQLARFSGLPAAEARRRAGEAIERVGLAEHGGKPLRRCSQGMRQRAKLAQALVHDPPVVILDEPMTGIDPRGREELMLLCRSLEQEGKTLLVSTHILHEIEEMTDRIVLLARGRVLARGTVRSIRDLLEDHPLTIRIGATRSRELARALAGREEVVGIALEKEGELVVKVRQPERFFRELPALVLSHPGEVDRVEPLDASAEAVFEYLVRARGMGIMNVE